jgi:4-amino-4-deoxy-L-arabinose transferase-like glycosyltransferase
LVVVDLPRRVRPGSYLFFFAFITVIVFLTHIPLLRLPFYWDELGQFVPASLDLFQTGAWIPYTTVPNIHPPGVMAYLAGFWHLAGYSVLATRVAMLLLASLGAFCTFLLAITLGREASGFPAFVALMFLCLSPLFVAQSMMAQLDMPAMVFTALALLLFLQNHLRRAALVCVLLVMVKETGIIAPMTFGFVLLMERRPKEALLFTAPLLPLAVWLFALHRATGHWAGNESFAAYNAFYMLNPVRFLLAVIRRLYYLFIGTGHWAGTLALIYASRHTRFFLTRNWKVAGIFAAAHVLMVCAFGGAVLERYLLPVLPLLYAAFAISFASLPGRWRISAFALFPMLIAANFVNPPYPFPFENNLAFAHFVELNERAADFVENNYPGATVSTTFPIAGALRRPDFGYVSKPIKVLEIEDFRLTTIARLRTHPPDAIVLYSVTWDPLNILKNPTVSRLLSRYYDYQPQATADEIEQALQMHSMGRWSEGGQWIQVLESDDYRPRRINARRSETPH